MINLNKSSIFSLYYLLNKRPSKKYVYGSRFNIDINVQVTNKKEDAFESQCILTLPYGVNYVKTFSSQNFAVWFIFIIEKNINIHLFKALIHAIY